MGKRSLASGSTPTSANSIATLQKLVQLLQDHTDKQGRLVSELFLELPSKDDYPDYYVLIKNPIALDEIMERTATYKSIEELRKDVRLMVDNAQTYNMKGSGVYKDAQTLWNLFDKAYRQELGLPAAESSSATHSRKSSLGGSAAVAEVKKAAAASSASPATGSKKAGSNVFMPVLDQLLQLRKGPRRVCELFEELPSKTDYPDYYEIIDSPISFAEIKQKLKENQYKNIAALEEDVRLMVENAKTYNEPGSFVYNDAVDIWNRFYELTKQFRGEEKPLSSVSVGGKTYHPGDYVYLHNDQDKSRPLILLIHRVFQAGSEKYIYGNYFLRPVQTVHPAKRRFYKNEVFKSDRFVTLPIAHIQGLCCVLSLRDYLRGRPKEFANPNHATSTDKNPVILEEKEADVFLCESRYIERGQKMEKIMGWLQNMPDRLRTREKTWEQNPGTDFLLFPRSINVPKEPSPFAHLAEEEAGGEEESGGARSEAPSDYSEEEDEEYMDERRSKKKSAPKQKAAAPVPAVPVGYQPGMMPPGVPPRGASGMTSQQAALMAQQQAQYLLSQAQNQKAAQRPAQIPPAQWAAMHPTMRMQVQQQIHLQMLQQQQQQQQPRPAAPGYPGPYGGVGRPAAAPIKVATDTLPEITASHFEQRDGKVVWYPGPPLILVRPPRAIHSLAYQEWKKNQNQNAMDVDEARPKSPSKKRQRVSKKPASKPQEMPWEFWKKSLETTSERLLQESRQLISHLGGSHA